MIKNYMNTLDNVNGQVGLLYCCDGCLYCEDVLNKNIGLEYQLSRQVYCFEFFTIGLTAIGLTAIGLTATWFNSYLV